MLPWFLQKPGLAARRYGDGPYLVFDYETTNLDKGWAGNDRNRLVLAGWLVGNTKGLARATPGGVEKGQHYGDEFSQAAMAALLERAQRERWLLVAHNAKFEAGWVRRMGFDPAAFLWWDTQIGEYVLLGNNPQHRKLNLDATARRYGRPPKDPVVQAQFNAGVCPSVIDERALADRNMKDVEDTHAVFLAQRERLTRGQMNVLFTRCLSVPVIESVERQGVAVHAERVRAARAEAEQRLAALGAEWAAFEALHVRTGKPADTPEWFGSKPFTWTTDQVAWVLYRVLGAPELRNKRGEYVRNKATKRWPAGRPIVNAKSLQRLKLTTPEQKEFLRLRGAIAKEKASISKVLAFYEGVVTDHGGVFYGQFNQTVTQTHRLSSSGRPLRMPDGKIRGVQLQNDPRRYKDLKTAKRAGYKRAQHDAAQLEFRVAVELGNDQAGRDSIARGEDRHRMTASALLQKAVSDITAEERQNAKSETFKPLYGGMRGTEAQERYYAAFREWFPGIASAQEGWTREVLATGKLVLPWGLEFYWPGTRMDPRTGYIDNTTQIYNYPIQSFATADIVPVAIVYLFHRMREALPDAVLVNMVHDSAEAEIPDTQEARAAWLALGIQTFGDDVYRYLWEVYGMRWQTTLGLGTKVEGEAEVTTELTLPW